MCRTCFPAWFQQSRAGDAGGRGPHHWVMRPGLHAIVVIVLTLLTQLGGLAWLVSLAFRWRLPEFLGACVALSLGAARVAPAFGRVHPGCGAGDGPLVSLPAFCALNRSYATHDMAGVLRDLAQGLDRAIPARGPSSSTRISRSSVAFPCCRTCRMTMGEKPTPRCSTKETMAMSRARCGRLWDISHSRMGRPTAPTAFPRCAGTCGPRNR